MKFSDIGQQQHNSGLQFTFSCCLSCQAPDAFWEMKFSVLHFPLNTEVWFVLFSVIETKLNQKHIEIDRLKAEDCGKGQKGMYPLTYSLQYITWAGKKILFMIMNSYLSFPYLLVQQIQALEKEAAALEIKLTNLKQSSQKEIDGE